MKQPIFTAVTGEAIEPGAVARVAVGVRGILPCRIVDTTSRGSVVVQPLSAHGSHWDGERSVPANDVWFLLTPGEVRALGVRS